MADNACKHCGADCGKSPVVWNDMQFCCNGCQQVYQLLNDNSMQQYYEYTEQPGVKVEDIPHHSKYAFLDKPEVAERFYDFYDSNIAKVTLYVPTIHCISCVWLLEHLNKLNKGIKQSSVNFVKKTITVSFNTSEITLRQLVEMLVSIHYIPDISLQNLEKNDTKTSNRSLWYKIGVAGFVFGNVMLYSLPEYFNGEPLEGSFGKFLYYLMYVLTVPVVFYSGSDYLISAIKNLRKGIINIDLPIAIGILTLFVVTSYEVLLNQGSGYSDSLSGFLFFLLLGRWYQSKTYEALAFDRDYKSYFPVAVTRITENGDEGVLLEEVEKDDLLLIRNKELIPADSILINGNAFIDYSFVTGESNPVKKDVGDFLYAGGVQTEGAITIKVTTEVAQSHLTQLWNQSDDKEKNNSALVSIIDKISSWFTIIVIIIAISGFLYWMIHDDLKTALLVLTSVLIVACPCALALSVPFTFGNAMRIFGLNGMYIKNTSIIEKLTKIDTIVFDKTGTLTKPDENNVQFIGDKLTELELQMAVSLAYQSTHPMSYAISKYYNTIEPIETKGYVEVAGRGVFAEINGRKVKIGAKEYVGDNEGKNSSNQSSVVYVSIDGKIKGFFKISNQYRDGIKEVIHSLKTNYPLYLLSGDNDTERENLESLFLSDSIFFNQKPLDKMLFIENLITNGRNVLMTGDGLNDSGAFLKSDVALSIADDIYHFSPAGDAIVDAKKFHLLAKYLKFARTSLKIVKQSFIISILYNGIGLGFALTGNLSPVVAAILMPISSVTVVLFTTFATKAIGNKLFP